MAQGQGYNEFLVGVGVVRSILLKERIMSLLINPFSKNVVEPVYNMLHYNLNSDMTWIKNEFSFRNYLPVTQPLYKVVLEWCQRRHYSSFWCTYQSLVDTVGNCSCICNFCISVCLKLNTWFLGISVHWADFPKYDDFWFPVIERINLCYFSFRFIVSYHSVFNFCIVVYW